MVPPGGPSMPSHADAQRQEPPPPQPRWWLVRSPDGEYLDARPLTHDEWSDLHHAAFSLTCHGVGAAGEIRARAALATLTAQIGGGASRRLTGEPCPAACCG